ncbi:LOW QUALITY PROTEIN: NUT family member 2F [Trichechus inunguis]
MLKAARHLWSVPKPVEIASEGATPVLGPDMTMNPGASVSPFTVLPFTPTTPEHLCQTPWEQYHLPLTTSSCPPGIPLGLSALPRTLVVPGVGYSGPTGTRPGKVIVQVRTEGRSAELPGTQTIVITHTPLNWSAPGALGGAVEHIPPPFGEVSAMQQMIPATSVVGTQACREGWSPAISLQIPPPAAQLASIFPQVKSWSGQHASSGEESLASRQSTPSLDDSSCNPKSVYENYRRWQCFKSLARRHHPHSPDIEALSCFLIPVLQSLARLKPTMTLEEGLWRSVQEWEHKSNFDRMIFYEMAGKFMEFEAEEELQIQKLQQRNVSVCLPLPAPQTLDPHGPSSTVIGQHPVFIPKNGGPKAQPLNQHQHRLQGPWEPKRLNEIPPKAIKEYVEIMEALFGAAHSAVVETDGTYQEEENEQQQEDDGIYPAPGLLSYIDQLCSQEAFITKVEAVIHPQFLEMLLSPESQVDPTSLTQELEKEEGLTLQQLVEKRLLELNGKVGVEAPPTYGVPPMESLCTESGTSEDAGSTDNHGLQLGISEKMSTKSLNVYDLSKSKDLAVFTRSPKSQKPTSELSTSPEHGPSRTFPRLGTREDLMFLETSPISETPGKEGSSEEEEEELPSLAFLLAPQESLLPWSLSKNPLPASGILHHGVRGTWQASQPLSPETMSLRKPGHKAAKSKIPAQVRDPSLPAKRPYSGADHLGVSGKQHLVVDPGLLSYTDKLCSQEVFITKVEADIPQFLEMVLSPELQVDPISLMQELKKEEGLTLTQLVEKQQLELKGKVCVEAPPTYGVPLMESLCTESGTSEDAGSTDNHGLLLGISKKMNTKS